MDNKVRVRVQLNCLYEMFRDKVEEDVVYFVYTENEGRIEPTIDQLMSIAASSFTGYDFQTSKPDQEQQNQHQPLGRTQNGNYNVSSNSAGHSNTRENSKSSISSSTRRSSSATGENADTRSNEDEDENMEIGEHIDKLQKNIEDLLEEKKSYHDKASLYQSRRMFQVTSYYSDMGSQIRRMIENNTKKLVELLLKQSNNANQIDLHGLNPVQARLVVTELLNLRQPQLKIDKDGEASIDIITGWGKHSEFPGHRIKAQIKRLLNEKGYQYEHLNKGALRVTIRR